MRKLFGTIVIPDEVYAEVVVVGAGLSGATEISNAPWIEVRQLRNHADLSAAQVRFGLGAGELSAILLARELDADLVILDDLAARKLAKNEGFKVLGCVSILEASFRQGYLVALRQAYEKMVQRGVHLSRQILDLCLKSFNLPPL